MDYQARVVLDILFPDDEAAVERLVDGLIDGLEMYGGTITRTPFGRIGLIFTVPADSLRQATSTALDVATAAGHPEPLAVEGHADSRKFRRRVDEGLSRRRPGGGGPDLRGGSGRPGGGSTMVSLSGPLRDTRMYPCIQAAGREWSRRPGLSPRADGMNKVVGARELLRDDHAPSVDDEFAGLGLVQRSKVGVDPVEAHVRRRRHVEPAVRSGPAPPAPPWGTRSPSRSHPGRRPRRRSA